MLYKYKQIIIKANKHNQQLGVSFTLRYIRQLIPVLFVLILCLLPVSAQWVGESNDDRNLLTYEVELRGGSLNFDRDKIVSSDIVCHSVFHPLSDGYIDVAAKFIEGGVECASIESHRVPVVWEITDMPGERRILTMDISDYRQDLFVTIRLLNNGSASVYIAADIDDTQYSVVGLTENLPTFEAKETHLENLTDVLIIDRLMEERAPSTAALIWTPAGHSLTKNGVGTGFTPAGPPMEPRIYCVVHEVFFDSRNDIPEQVGTWCVSYSWIMYKVYREDVSEAQIKSDLSYYNKKHDYIDGRSKIMGAYEIDTHGLANDEPDRPLMSYDSGWLYPSEVEDIWGDLGDYYVRPDSTIVLATACQSLWNTGESSGSEMGDAFMDFGAQAYVGATIDIPVAMDSWLEAFWWSLTYENESLEKAVDDANYIKNWSSDEMRLHPDTSGSGKMPN